MKEKVIFTLSLAFFIGIMWISSTTHTMNVKPVISEKLTTSTQDSNIIDYIDDIYLETTYVDDGTMKSDFSVVEACSLKPIETDVYMSTVRHETYLQKLLRRIFS